MGYDMYFAADWEIQPDLQDLPFNEGFEKWKVWRQGIEEHEGYYRLNIWGMGDMRELLYAGGCLNVEVDFDISNIDDAIEEDTGGVLPAYKVSDNSGWLVSPAECIATAMRWFEGAGREQARTQAAETAAAWTNNGQPITDEKVLEWVDDFVRWIGVAAGHEGFRVH